MRLSPLVLAALLGGSLLTACGPSGLEKTLPEPPSPARTGPALPLTPVRQPVDLAKFDTDPCGLLTKEQVAAVVADPPDIVSPRRSSTEEAVGCVWTSGKSPAVSVLKPLTEPKTLAALKDTPRRVAGAMDSWTEVSVSGLPAAIFHETSGANDCAVGVAVTDTDMLIFSYRGEGAPSVYWDKDRCGGVLKTAEFVLGNLRSG
ncbi:DUF3558 domain-containing protein [Amycolatopsis sp. SID8362]|uniref:DUF3558 domain-containing protein n=1 Tax=Amycolatopsis sp. SID8362 TaxID=2690346 RepID=UPI00136973BC|nr:DUF3558 domain-containing protein [Amycolatopsis sp. SID8362]NBH09752.1 DUF3558 domain-containing protein [Amycolatopsis sp. SID8362]NED46445.1 DUF3558 domain-containing protein [Amycolatopsis sp. SID8362]